MNSFHGYKIIVTPDRPKMQLSPRVREVLTPAQIADHNAWMLQFFGTTNLLEDGVTWFDEGIGSDGKLIMMNPRTHEALKKVTW